MLIQKKLVPPYDAEKLLITEWISIFFWERVLVFLQIFFIAEMRVVKTPQDILSLSWAAE